MYDYKTLRKIIVTLAVLFGVALVVFVVTSLPLNKFALMSLLLLVIVGIYFTSIPLRLLREMSDLEQRAELYKRKCEQIEKENKPKKD